MKTSEFIEKLDKHKGKFLIENIFSDDELYLTSIKTNQFNITFYYDEEPNEIIDIIAEYLNTPVSEREEEKKYYLKLKGFSNKEETYLCEDDFWSYWILIDKDELTHGDEFRFKFTQSEIDELPECYTHPAVWEQIEVESEEE